VHRLRLPPADDVDDAHQTAALRREAARNTARARCLALNDAQVRYRTHTNTLINMCFDITISHTAHTIFPSQSFRTCSARAMMSSAPSPPYPSISALLSTSSSSPGRRTPSTHAT
jgi:hypothetical protein